MLEKRQARRTIRGVAAIAMLLAVAGCGGGSEPKTADYPFAAAPDPDSPVRRSVDPSPTCERELATFHDGSKPARRSVVIPPAPGLRAVAVTQRVTRLEWSFEDLPPGCRPVTLAVSVVASGRATPTTQRVKITGRAGRLDVEYPDFLPPPDVALASAYTLQGRRSRTVSVAIRRSPNTPPDRPEPAPPLTAPAGSPIACGGRTTRAIDPEGDVLTYAPGSPPRRVANARPRLAAIDLIRAAVQIDGPTICAVLVFAAPVEKTEFELMVAVRDPEARSCCAALHFRRTARGVEVGHRTIDANGAYRLEPVPNAGASLRGDTLRLTGTLPGAAAATRDIGWSVTSSYADGKYGPFYGDWLPGYASAAEPFVRHRDGATVRR